MSSESAPFLVRIAKPLSSSSSLATSVRTAVQVGEVSAGTSKTPLERFSVWDCAGATYDERLQLWLHNGYPLVLDPDFKLGTRSVTNVVKEEQDED